MLFELPQHQIVNLLRQGIAGPGKLGMDALHVERTIRHQDGGGLVFARPLLAVIDRHVLKATGLLPVQRMFAALLVVAQFKTADDLGIRVPDDQIEMRR